jgi:hypothetical protein
MLAPQLRLGLLKLSKIDAAKDYAVRGLRALTGFAGKLKLTYGDIEVGIDYESEPSLADNGDLEGDSIMLLEQVGAAASRQRRWSPFTSMNFNMSKKARWPGLFPLCIAVRSFNCR